MSTSELTEVSEVLPYVDGKLLGLYKNPPPSSEHLLITSEGIAIVGTNQSRFLRYSEMQRPEICSGGRSVRTDPSRKLLADTISIFLEDGTQLHLPIRGSHDHYRDVFEFWSFLRIAIDESTPLQKNVSSFTPF
jgi:hypothetical protein